MRFQDYWDGQVKSYMEPAPTLARHRVIANKAWAAALKENDKAFRSLLFKHHSHEGMAGCTYSDNMGYMACSVCKCDFSKDTFEQLDNKMYNYNMRRLISLGKGPGTESPV